MLSKGIKMESTAIQQMVDNIIAGKQADALQDFNSAIASKITDALDVRKQEIASSLGKTEVTEDETV
jgi:hypothetical protein